MKPVFAAVLLCALLLVDDIHALPRRESGTKRAVYGTDNRIDEYQVVDNDVKSTGSSTVAIIPKIYMSKVGATYTINPELVDLLEDTEVEVGSEEIEICDDVKFANQPSIALCSGFLIDNDKIATAGHCIIDEETCGMIYFVFNYVMTSENVPVLAFPEANVYSCKSFKIVMDGGVSFAVVTTDRPVTGRTPLVVDPTLPQKDDPLYFIGHPTGLPRKYADGASIDLTPADINIHWMFVADLDAFGGNYGSAVFHSGTNKVAGIFSIGATDYVKDTGRNCAVPNVCSELDTDSEDCTGEYVLLSKAITPFISVTCTNNGQCSNNGVCQDGQCKCNTGFYGTDCSFQCSRDVCSNHGECVGLWECKCDSGYEGDLCFEKSSANGIRPASVFLALVSVIAAIFVSF